MMRQILLWGITLCATALTFAQNMGVVDYERVINESTYVKTRLEQLQALEQRYRGALQVLQENAILTDEERQEMTTLLLADNLNDAQRQRLQQLSTTSRQRSEELQSLRQKPSPSETEKAALERFTQMEVRGREALQALAQQLSQQLEQRVQQSREDVRKVVREVIGQIAKEKRLAVVFSAETVLFADNDITDEVIKRLNERK